MKEHLEIIRLVGLGDRKAFQRLYDLYISKVYNLSLSYVQNVEDAEEITQNVFEKIYFKANEFKGDSSVSTWVYRIAINSALNFIRSKKRIKHYLFPLKEVAEVPTFDHPGVLLENKEKSVLLFSVINKLPDNQKTAFILTYIDGLPQKEIAAVLGVSVKAVESLLQRGKKNLRRKLENVSV